jgi:hypothetical protein
MGEIKSGIENCFYSNDVKIAKLPQYSVKLCHARNAWTPLAMIADLGVLVVRPDSN